MPEPSRRRRTYLFSVLSVLALVVLSCAGLNHWTDINRIKSGAEYESQIANWPQDLVKDFPKKIPPGATGVRMRSDSPSLMIGPGHFIQLRFIGAPADVKGAIAAGEAAVARVKPAAAPDARHAAESLRVLRSGDQFTPLPQAFQCYLLVTQAENFAGVVVNPETGEIAYWASIN